MFRPASRLFPRACSSANQAQNWPQSYRSFNSSPRTQSFMEFKPTPTAEHRKSIRISELDRERDLLDEEDFDSKDLIAKDKIETLLMKMNSIADTTFIIGINRFLKSGKIRLTILENTIFRGEQRVIYLSMEDAKLIIEPLKTANKIYEDLAVKLKREMPEDIPENLNIWEQNYQLADKVFVLHIRLLPGQIKGAGHHSPDAISDEGNQLIPVLFVKSATPERLEETFVMIPCVGLYRFIKVLTNLLAEFETKKEELTISSIKNEVTKHHKIIVGSIFVTGLLGMISYVSYVVYLNT